jgi:hypothetical protein
MFDIGNISKMAQEAKQMQARQEQLQQEQAELLKRIADKLDEVIGLLKQNLK